ncbi:uncharacterized protein B0J16DRAFT_324662 [Fusarium flagelliforme]|uniref:uncharacterized protein n=1 Tax=Fusarium flagelliforme TaxID=2675880 RepID=UPI001E8CEAE4|nr:uncharacterized protein B0J16DRAFT_324662 [Fusarium flagelliforme]KAH7173161.1 hypothetical protein B0J16DRAFT_324662 [Fusarium flagelliforme]
MKPSILTLAAVLALSGVGESRKWDCQSVGKGRPSNQKLKDAAWDFDRLFGKNLLTARSNQCYVSHCRGHYFAFCNTAGVTRKEKKGHRVEVKDKGLPHGQADNCNVSVGDWIADSYNVYRFGSLKHLSKDSCLRRAKCGVFRNDIRKC